jgi:hypothetical protein
MNDWMRRLRGVNSAATANVEAHLVGAIRCSGGAVGSPPPG